MKEMLAVTVVVATEEMELADSAAMVSTDDSNKIYWVRLGFS